MDATAPASAGTLFDPQTALDRWQETTRKAAQRALDLFSTSVGRISDAEVESARAAGVPGLVALAENRAAMRRGIADLYVSTVRGLIDV